MIDTLTILTDVESVLRTHRFRFQSEAVLQEGIAQVFKTLPHSVIREYILSKKDRLDFFVGEAVVVEAKIDHSLRALTAQVHRYAQDDRVKAILVVVTKRRLANLPESFNGKPIRVVDLIQSVF